jgi:hypothetical protein
MVRHDFANTFHFWLTSARLAGGGLDKSIGMCTVDPLVCVLTCAPSGDHFTLNEMPFNITINHPFREFSPQMPEGLIVVLCKLIYSFASYF